MGPGVYRDIILISLEGDVEFLPVLDDIDADVEVGRSDLVLAKECIQPIGRLKQACSQNAQFPGTVRSAPVQERAELTGRGPSSKEIPTTPAGASHI